MCVWDVSVICGGSDLRARRGEVKGNKGGHVHRKRGASEKCISFFEPPKSELLKTLSKVNKQ